MFGKYTTYGITDHIGTFYAYINNGGNNISASASPYSGTWHHFAETFDGTTMSLYIDGGLVTSKTSASPSTGTSGSFSIGLANAVLNGSIDDVRIYNRALSATEIQTMYNAGK